MSDPLTDVEIKGLYDGASTDYLVERLAADRAAGKLVYNARIVRLIDEVLALRAKAVPESERVTELLGVNTRLENVNRMVRAQLDAAKKLLKFVLIDKPITMDIAEAYGASKGEALRADKEILSLYQRIELLEKDAWTATMLETREFVKEAELVINNEHMTEDCESAVWLTNWTERLKKALG